ncbi:hypothetical protein XAC3810_430184 [Xanthomonas citri pv. citri]|uniref:Uncharacterized protein n=1 Tax=Xanthomonas citri pv. citri TaxID=611301 RepID=A0A0U5FEH4_XANCI|nr:hypothetical protein XAC9322_430209 [Xanthomonas citri pv. citri]CEJ44341.1 hypothetical protein XAB3213_2520006 [Xanthomonas citri pv. bilvae]CEE27905.1 hypothetical protein XAC3824_520022 [Xanthomonas citri pv. citri]CEE29438.1 hypothetical protein XAC1083_430208 [Xanthomonas citri pv. citri]CEE38581.1 hypothetical protein XAC3810_430184 [Xanthomonas citri pv. citri]
MPSKHATGSGESGISLKQGRQSRFSVEHLRMVEGGQWRSLLVALEHVTQRFAGCKRH